jgi:prophage tail gpP-like protein
MSLQIRLNGLDLVNFKEASVFRSMESVSGNFSLISTADEQNQLPININNAVEIVTDETTILTGFVEGIESDAAPDSHDFKATGRDILGDLVDSTVGDVKEFTGSVQLIDICRAVLDGINLNNVGIVDETAIGITGPSTSLLPFSEFDITSADIGTKGFEFLEPFARKRQVLLTTDGQGNLILARNTGIKLPVKLKTGTDGNLKNTRKIIDNTQRYRVYTAHSQLNPIRMTAGTTPEEIVQQRGLAEDTEIRSSRIFAFNAEESSDSFTAEERAIWEANIRRAQSLSYTGTVQGHSAADGVLWLPNRLVDVEDEFNDVQATLLIRSVRYNSSIELGNTTTLEMTFNSAYTLQAEADRQDVLSFEGSI